MRVTEEPMTAAHHFIRPRIWFAEHDRCKLRTDATSARYLQTES
jgi:hypothetical protein